MEQQINVLRKSQGLQKNYKQSKMTFLLSNSNTSHKNTESH